MNSYRFAGTVQEGAFAMSADAVATFAGSGVASAYVSSTAEAGLILENDQAGSGAISMGGESASTFSGASIASAVASGSAEATLTLAGTSGAATVDAADFDGTNDLLNRGAITGISDNKKGIVSVWVKRDQITNGETFLDIFTGNTHILKFDVLSSANSSLVRVRLRLTDATNVVIDSTASGGISTTTAWYHALASWDMSTSSVHLFVNDVDRKGSVTGVADLAVDYSLADETNVAADLFDAKYDGGMAELYFTTEYLDFSVEENRRKFISSTGKPVQLGATGEAPTGTAALIFLHLDDGETANNFAVNRGTGGNFTVTGALTTYSSSPSD